MDKPKKPAAMEAGSHESELWKCGPVTSKSLSTDLHP